MASAQSDTQFCNINGHQSCLDDVRSSGGLFYWHVAVAATLGLLCLCRQKPQCLIAAYTSSMGWLRLGRLRCRQEQKENGFHQAVRSTFAQLASGAARCDAYVLATPNGPISGRNKQT